MMSNTAALTKDHYLDLHDGRFTGTSKADLDRLFVKLADDPDRERLVVHFHGGNVARAEGLANAEQMLPLYREAGAYPVFFIWHSGIGEVINDLRIRWSRSWHEQARDILSVGGLKRIRKLRPGHVLDFGYMLKRLFTRFANGRSHGLRATTVEEFMRVFFLTDFGDRVWRLMKHEARNAFRPDEHLYGGTAFLTELGRRWNDGYHPRIILVAHSGGSIFLCHFLQNAATHLPQAKFDVVFLAAAVTVELFHETLEKHGDSIANFRNFALADDLECEDKLIPVLYPRSLLYFMSGVCEHDDKTRGDLGDVPLVGMQRYVRDERTYPHPDVSTLRRFLTEKNRAAWSIEKQGPGLATTTTEHVGFCRDPATLSSIQYIVKHGF
jgi:hypothetical protein